MRLIILLTCCFAIFTACKDEETKEYSIKGRLINACDGSPLANETVTLSQVKKASQPYHQTPPVNASGSVITNTNGEFEMIYETNHKRENVILNKFFNVPVENLDLGDIPYQKTLLVFYKVKVNNPYTHLDTLYFSDVTDYILSYKMSGPFHDTVIGLRTLYSNENLTYNATLKKIINNDSQQNINAYYSINSTNNSFQFKSTNTILLCNAVADTLVLNIN